MIDYSKEENHPLYEKLWIKSLFDSLQLKPYLCQLKKELRETLEEYHLSGSLPLAA